MGLFDTIDTVKKSAQKAASKITPVAPNIKILKDVGDSVKAEAQRVADKTKAAANSAAKATKQAVVQVKNDPIGSMKDAASAVKQTPELLKSGKIQDMAVKAFDKTTTRDSMMKAIPAGPVGISGTVATTGSGTPAKDITVLPPKGPVKPAPPNDASTLAVDKWTQAMASWRANSTTDHGQKATQEDINVPLNLYQWQRDNGVQTGLIEIGQQYQWAPADKTALISAEDKAIIAEMKAQYQNSG